MTRIGGQGLTKADIEDRDKLIQKLRDDFKKIKESIDEYEKTVESADGWIVEMKEKFQEYYEHRTNAWQEEKDDSKTSKVYEKFSDEWDLVVRDGLTVPKELEDIKVREDDMSKILEGLPAKPDRRTKKKLPSLFSRKLG
ncbi:MAG: hypothetical protein LH649_14320 [Pseudanabaena sp. CAN_BIN31]|nr:hypothetical protein [Pseudanabaena sp. CAN_BIN31]